MQTLPDKSPTRRAILISAFACSPRIGSEPGVGWRWAIELAEQHDVHVVTHPFFREHIESQLLDSPVSGLSFSYFTAPGIPGSPLRHVQSRAYYWLWQLSVRGHVKSMLQQRTFDVIHHLTWGSYRLPCFLGGLGVPLVIGPVGGGEGAPSRMYRKWPWKEQLFWRVRQASIMLSRWDPLVIMTMAGASCILTKTSQTRDALPRFARSKAFDAMEIGVNAVGARRPRSTAQQSTLELLYAGRLIGGKGVPYLVRMMKVLVSRKVNVRLRIAGDGRMAEWLRAQVQAAGLTEHVSLLGMVTRERLADLYGSCDLLVFPSWFDSSGNVVTEALSHGLPVMCLDLGGPGLVVDDRCAVVVPTAGCDEDGISQAMASRIERLFYDRARLARLAAGAIERVRELSWSSQVARAYHIIEERLGWPRSAKST